MIAIELPEQYAPTLKSGEKNMTFQFQDEVKVGDIVTVFAGPVRRRVKVVNKIWVPETQMSPAVRDEIIKTVPQDSGFSGAFRINFKYVDEPIRQRYGEDIDKIANMI